MWEYFSYLYSVVLHRNIILDVKPSLSLTQYGVCRTVRKGSCPTIPPQDGALVQTNAVRAPSRILPFPSATTLYHTAVTALAPPGDDRERPLPLRLHQVIPLDSLCV